MVHEAAAFKQAVRVLALLKTSDASCSRGHDAGQLGVKLLQVAGECPREFVWAR
jgi:hypothetical protein